MVSPTVVPLLLGAAIGAAGAGGCRRPETHALVTGPAVPALETRLLESRPFDGDSPPAAAAAAAVAATEDQGAAERGGAVPESLVVGGDCRVHAIWWTTHLCGLQPQGSTRWVAGKGTAVVTVKLQGVARTDCPALVSRFETVIEGLPDGAYKFGTWRRAVEFTVRCADRR